MIYAYVNNLCLCVLSVAFLWFACDFGWASDPSFCGWMSEDSGFRWQVQSSGTPTLNTGPNMDHTGKKKKHCTHWPHSTVNVKHPKLTWFLSACCRRIRELHLHTGNRCSGDRSGSVSESVCVGPGLGPVLVLLVSHVWLSHRHATHQTAQRKQPGLGWCPALDGQRSSRQPLEGGPCAHTPLQQTLPGTETREADVYDLHWLHFKYVVMDHKTSHKSPLMVWTIFENLESEGAKTSKYWENHL